MCLIAIPALLVGYDFWRFPVTFEVKALARHADLVSLVRERLFSLGTYNSHSMHLSLDAIERDDFLDYVNGSGNALVIGYFLTESSELRGGALGSAVSRKIERVDPEAGRHFRDQLEGLGGRQAGQVSKVSLRISPQAYRRFPIDHIYVVFFHAGLASKNEGLIAKAMPQVLRNAEYDNISNLIVPCLAHNWEDKNTVAFDEFFDPLLTGLAKTGPPQHVYIPLYAGWPTVVLEEAVGSLNHFWENIASLSESPVWRFYRADIRGTLFFVFVCLVISSFTIPITIKNFLIIAFLFAGMSAAAVKTAAVLIQGQNALVHAIVQLCIWVSLAVGLRFFANWNPRSIFTETGSSND